MLPQDRVSPRNRLTPPIAVLIATPSWTVAEFGWDGEPRVMGICWNGNLNDPNDKGNPRSHGEGTWFIVPSEISRLIRWVLPLLQPIAT